MEKKNTTNRLVPLGTVILMRRLTTLAMVLALGGGLAGCGGSRADSSSVSSSSEGAKLTREVAGALGEKATADFHQDDCPQPSEADCVPHERTRFVEGDCEPNKTTTGFNWVCSFEEVTETEVNETDRVKNLWLVATESGGGCWKTVRSEEQLAWEHQGLTILSETVNTKPKPYVENCTLAGHENVGRPGPIGKTTEEQARVRLEEEQQH